MYQIIKFTGVSPEALAALHEVLKGDRVRGKNPIKVYVHSKEVKDLPIHARILKAQLEAPHKGYKVEVQVAVEESVIEYDRSESGKVTGTVQVSLGVVLAVYEALGIYPKDEQVVKVEEAA